MLQKLNPKTKPPKKSYIDHLTPYFRLDTAAQIAKEYALLSPLKKIQSMNSTDYFNCLNKMSFVTPY